MTTNEGNRPRIKDNQETKVTYIHGNPEKAKSHKERKGNLGDEIKRIENEKEKNKNDRFKVCEIRFIPDAESHTIKSQTLKEENFNSIEEAEDHFHGAKKAYRKKGNILFNINDNIINSFVTVNENYVIYVFVDKAEKFIDENKTTSLIFSKLRRLEVEHYIRFISKIARNWEECLHGGPFKLYTNFDGINKPVGRVAWYKDDKSPAHKMRENKILINLNDIKTIVYECVNNVMKGLV